MYNRYASRGQFRPACAPPPEPPGKGQNSSQKHGSQADKPRPRGGGRPQDSPCHESPPRNHETRSSETKLKDCGSGGFLKNLLPEGLDIGDILLFLILFLAYKDSGDEELLIILIAMIFMTLN